MSSPEDKIPAHVGIIMDGNGRWAGERGLPRTSGHREGLEAAKRIVAHASDSGISALSLYAFSTENWKRAEDEVNFLMGLIRTHLRRQYDFYRKRGLRIVHSGHLDGLPHAVREEILLAEEETASFTGMTVNLLINYGGRDEIIRAVQRHFAQGGTRYNLDENAISTHLDCPALPDMDLIIRTGGELRLSNFLLWRAAYAEFHFSSKFWPDWGSEDFNQALAFYGSRQRRFGGVPQ